MTREELKTKVEFVTDEQVKKIVYVFVTTDTTAPGASDFGTSVPTKTDAGTYYVWLKVKNPNRATANVTPPLEVTIAKADITGLTVSINAWNYGDPANKPSLNKEVEGSVFYCLLDTDEKPDTLLGFPLVSYLKLERIDTIMVHGQYHRRFTLTFLDSFHEPIRNEWEAVMDNVVWVEGVGTAAGPFLPWLPLSYKDWVMMNCREGNRNLLFGNRDFNTNVVDAVSDVRRKVNGNDDSYDLQGCRIQDEPLSKSVYIREGMKYVKK